MNTYAIYEENIERLEKKLTTIKNKCNKYGIDFHYARVGEEFRESKDNNGDSVTLRYILVEAEGAVIHNDWEFVAVVDHHESGNVIRQYKTDIIVPDRYYSTSPICEHCNTQRKRKDTYLIHNTATNEWKQVGKTCLTEFTQGMDAEGVAKYLSAFDELIKGEAPYSGSSINPCFPVLDILRYAFETVKHFGYQSWSEWEPRCTRSRCMDYYYVGKRYTRYMSDSHLKTLKEEMDEVKFNAETEELSNTAQDAIDWVLAEPESNSYIHNLKVIVSSEYCSSKDLGILISLSTSYNRHLGKLAEMEAAAAARKVEANSKFIGEVGDKLVVEAKDIECVWSGANMYGMSYLYKFHDEDCNVYMWSTSTALDVSAKLTITGVVKKHEEFNKIKQTWLTRCKVKSDLIVDKESNNVSSAQLFDLDNVMAVFEGC